MRKPLHSRIFNIFYLAMSLMYIAMGVFFVAFPVAEIMLKKPVNYYFGGALLVYGAFRAYRAVSRFLN